MNKINKRHTIGTIQSFVENKKKRKKREEEKQPDI